MPKKFATFKQRAELRESIQKTEAMLNDPYRAQAITHKDKVRRNLAQEKAQLDAVSPPPLETDSRRRALMERDRKLREAMILGNSRKGIQPMPSVRMMQENPSGSTGKHIRFEKFWKENTIDDKGNIVKPTIKGRGAIFEWKDVRRELCQDQEMDDADIANIETFRPDNDQVPLADQHSPRSYGLSMAAKENFDQVFPDREPTPVEAKLAEGIEPKTWTICQATTKKGDICGRQTKDGKPYCFYANHRRQFEQVA